MDATPMPSESGCQLAPWSSERHTPPFAEPRYAGTPPGAAATVFTRPPTAKGPAGVQSTAELVPSCCCRSARSNTSSSMAAWIRSDGIVPSGMARWT